MINCKLSLKSFTKLFATWLFGYLTACFVLNKNIYINKKTGELKEEIRIFPFSISNIRHDRAFSTLYPHPSQNTSQTNSDWLIVDKNKFKLSVKIPMGYTVGRTFYTQQNILVNTFKEFDLTKNERLKISKKYYMLLRNGDYHAASEYVYEMVENGPPNHETRENK